MAETTPPAKPAEIKPQPATTIDFTKAIDNVDTVEKHVMTFAGKPGMNPHFFIRDNITPLKNSYDKGVRSKELFDKMMALTKVEPTAPKITAKSR